MLEKGTVCGKSRTQQGILGNFRASGFAQGGQSSPESVWGCHRGELVVSNITHSVLARAYDGPHECSSVTARVESWAPSNPYVEVLMPGTSESDFIWE